MNKEFAIKVLEHIPQDKKHANIRGTFLLYIEGNITLEVLATQQVYILFIQQQQKLINDLLYITEMDKKKLYEINNVHFNHHTSNIFSELGKKAAESGKTEYCKIKLACASGMTDFPQTVSWNEITKLIEVLLGAKTSLATREKFLDFVRNILLENGLLDNTHLEENVYRVGIGLSSKKEICLSIEHVSKKTESGFNGYFFSLSKNKQVIIDILERFGYEADNAIEEMFGPIIGIKKGDMNEEDNFNLA